MFLCIFCIYFASSHLSKNFLRPPYFSFILLERLRVGVISWRDLPISPVGMKRGDEKGYRRWKEIRDEKSDRARLSGTINKKKKKKGKKGKIKKMIMSVQLHFLNHIPHNCTIQHIQSTHITHLLVTHIFLLKYPETMPIKLTHSHVQIAPNPCI